MSKPETRIKNIIRDVVFGHNGDTRWVSQVDVPYFDGRENKVIRITFHAQTSFTKCGWVIVEHPDLGTWQANQHGNGYRIGTPQRTMGGTA